MSDVSFARAAGAYQDALRAANNILEKVGATSSQETASAKGSSFIDFVGSALQEAANTGYKSEAVSTRALSGKDGSSLWSFSEKPGN